MQKNLITAVALISLVVLSYVGIAQLNTAKKDLVPAKESIELDEDETVTQDNNGDVKGQESSKVTEAVQASQEKKVLPSGLSYIIKKAGTGETPKKRDYVAVHYTGWLLLKDKEGHDVIGTMFDSSKKRGQPFAFRLGEGQVIKGWDEGVATMKVGETRILDIPPALGYGAQSIGGIPENSTLRFEVELLAIRRM